MINGTIQVHIGEIKSSTADNNKAVGQLKCCLKLIKWLILQLFPAHQTRCQITLIGHLFVPRTGEKIPNLPHEEPDLFIEMHQM